MKGIYPSVTKPERFAGDTKVWSHWPAYSRALPVTGCPRRWALPRHFPDRSHERVLLPESFRGVAPSVDPASQVLNQHAKVVALPSHVLSDKKLSQFIHLRKLMTVPDAG